MARPQGQPAELDAGSPLDYSWFPFPSSVLVLGIHNGVSLFLRIFGFSGLLGRYPGPDHVMRLH
jgi:hypothetical protein